MASFSRHDQRRSLRAIRWPLRLTWAGLWAERLVQAFWPLGAVALAVLAALMLGLQDILPIEIVWTLAVASVLGAAVTLVIGLRRFRLPRRAEALARLDTSLPGRPIQALMDDQAIGADDAASAAVWRAHQKRMAGRAAQARPVPADLNTAPRDPFALRYVAMLAFAVALLFGSIWRVGSVTELTPGNGAVASGPVWEGWVEPPRYTGLPALYLNDQPEGALEVPVGSLITLRFYGDVGALTLAETVSARTGAVPAASDPVQDFVVRQSGTLAINGPGGRAWDIAMLPDAAPAVAQAGEVDTAALGQMTLPFRAQDDYGVEAGEARFTLDLAAVDRRYGLALDPEPLPPLIAPLPMPVAGGRHDFTEELIEDFSEHPWANLPVTLTLMVLDAQEQEGLSEPISMTLPGRRFFDPLAAALIETRRDLLWNRDNGARAAQVLRAVSHRGKDIFRTETIGLQTRTLTKKLELLAHYGLGDEKRDELAADLWDLALIIEEGDLADALERMERARQRLEEAMKNGASDEEIAELMRELRQATDEYLRQLARRAELDREAAEADEDTDGPQSDPNAMQLTQDDIQRMMDRIQELMEQGRMAEAEQALQELQELLENLRMTQGQQGEGNSPGQQAMEGLSDTLREQQGLSDQAFRDLQEQFNPGAQAGESQGNEGRSGGQGRGQSHENGGQGQGQGEGDSEDGGQGGAQGQGLPEDLADRQRALRQELNRQERSLPGQGSPEGDAAREDLGRAGRAMDDAEDSLRRNDYASAIDQQSRAMDALRDAMRDLADAMEQENQGQQPGQGSAGADRMDGTRDPLGRDSGSNGQFGANHEMLKGEDARRRAQELLDEIRRRSAEAERPEEERNYLKRLLDRF